MCLSLSPSQSTSSGLVSLKPSISPSLPADSCCSPTSGLMDRNWAPSLSPNFAHISAASQRATAEPERHFDVETCNQLCEQGRIAEAVDGLNLLVQKGYRVHNNLFYRVLQRCIANKDLALGRRIHALSIKCGYERDSFLATHLIRFYAGYGRLKEARRIFCTIPVPTLYNWATIISACVRGGEAAQALGLYRQMRDSHFQPDNRIYVAILKACATTGDLVAGKEVHADILVSLEEPNRFVQTGLLHMYAKCGCLQHARAIFDNLLHKDVVTWNAMLAGYVQQGMGQESLRLHSLMRQEGLTFPNSVTFLCLLQACANVGLPALHEGTQLCAQIEKRGLQDNVVLSSSLINMFAKCGSLKDARRVFDRLPHRNVVTWTTMIAGYAQQGMGQEALILYGSMQKEVIPPPDFVTFVCLLQACASVGVAALQKGKQLHAQIEERGMQGDVGVGCSLVDMYAKCGSLEEARSVFDRIPERDVRTWNAMLAGYARQGMGEEVFGLYGRMQQECVSSPDSVTFLCLLQSCVTGSDLCLGKQLHAEIVERGLQCEVVLGAALVTMYAKCGSTLDSQSVFDSMPERTADTWNALIGGYARQGHSDDVFQLLDSMVVEGTQPNDITLLSVLTVCSHAGLVDKGLQYFEAMRSDYGIIPGIEHYTCMIDLLGRAGHLDEVLQMVKTLPFAPNSSVWHTLLGACQKWNNVEIAQQAFEGAVRLDEKDGPSYALMSNIYATAHMWEEAKAMQAKRRECQAWKTAGQTLWTDTDGRMRSFAVGVRMNSHSDGYLCS